MARGTAAQREQWADERRAYERTLVTEGECSGYLILKHIDGSLFKAQKGCEEIFVSQRTKEPITQSEAKASMCSHCGSTYTTGGLVAGGFTHWKEE